MIIATSQAAKKNAVSSVIDKSSTKTVYLINIAKITICLLVFLTNIANISIGLLPVIIANCHSDKKNYQLPFQVLSVSHLQKQCT